MQINLPIASVHKPYNVTTNATVVLFIFEDLSEINTIYLNIVFNYQRRNSARWYILFKYTATTVINLCVLGVKLYYDLVYNDRAQQLFNSKYVFQSFLVFTAEVDNVASRIRRHSKSRLAC